jgi:outer membrane lipoprotein-sorting protein
MLQNKLLLICLFLIPGLALKAQDAEKIMKAVQEKYEAYKDMSINYYQKIVDAEGEVLSEADGHLYLMDDYFKIDMAGQVISSDNEKTWMLFTEERELTIDFIDEDMGFKPSDLFSLYKKNFIYKIDEKIKLNGTDHYVVRFTPVDKDEYEFHTIKLYVKVSDNSISKAEIIDASNTVITYDIKSIKPNQGFTKSFFQMNPKDYQGFIITDNTK